jgi:hypothetical protein
MRDERIFSTLLDLVSDPSRPQKIRVASLITAVDLADSVHVHFFYQIRRAPNGELYVNFASPGRHPGAEARPVGQPVLQPVQRLEEVMQQLLPTLDHDSYLASLIRTVRMYIFRVGRTPA